MLIRLTAFAAALLVTTAASAIELRDPVAFHQGKTYADLVGQFIDGFAVDEYGAGTANVTTPIRMVDEPEAIPEESDVPGAVTIAAIHAETIRSGGAPVLLVSVDLEGEDSGWPMVILGAFDENLKLIDKARVDLDRFVNLDDPLAISDEDDAVVVRSSHFNAGENYESTQLVYLTQGELTALPSIGAYSVLACGYQNLTRGDFTATDDGQPGFRPITATLRAEHVLMPDCPPDADAAPVEPAWSRTGTTTYVWSASMGLYIEQQSDMDTLASALDWYGEDEPAEGGE